MDGLLARYEAALVANQEAVLGIENILNTGALLLQSKARSGASQLREYGVLTLLKLFSLLNDAIILRKRAPQSLSLRAKSVALSVVGAGQTWFEILVHEKRPEWRWNALVALYLVKAALRMAILRSERLIVVRESDVTPPKRSSSGPLAQLGAAATGAPESADEEIPLNLGHLKQCIKLAANAGAPQGKRSKKPLPLKYDIERYRPTVQGDGHLLQAELLHALRPALYVMAIKRFGQKSWTPLLVSLAVSIAGLVEYNKASNPSARVAAERRARLLGVASHLLYPPVFQKVTAVPVLVLARLLGKLPGLGGLAGAVPEIIEFSTQFVTFYE